MTKGLDLYMKPRKIYITKGVSIYETGSLNYGFIYKTLNLLGFFLIFSKLSRAIWINKSYGVNFAKLIT